MRASKLLTRWAYTQQALQANVEPVVQAAKLAQDAAKQAHKNGKVEAARELFTKAYFLYQSAENLGHGTGNLASEALESLEDLRAESVKGVVQGSSGVEQEARPCAARSIA